VSRAPFDFGEAETAIREAQARQAGAETTLKEASKAAAAKEQTFRVALAKEIVRLHDSDKVAWTVCADLARGNEHVAQLRYERDVAQGVLEAAQQAAWRFAADRKDTGRLVDWSMRRELAEQPPLRSAA
jgi:hypothetical protein